MAEQVQTVLVDLLRIISRGGLLLKGSSTRSFSPYSSGHPPPWLSSYSCALGGPCSNSNPCPCPCLCPCPALLQLLLSPLLFFPLEDSTALPLALSSRACVLNLVSDNSVRMRSLWQRSGTCWSWRCHRLPVTQTGQGKERTTFGPGKSEIMTSWQF